MANVDLLGVIQMIVQENLKGQKLADKMTGTVVSVSPLSVQPDISMPPIPEAGLILTDAVKARIAAVKGDGGGTVEVASGLVVGDKVLMLRVSSGQCYIILSRL